MPHEAEASGWQIPRRDRRENSVPDSSFSMILLENARNRR
jgi:hypothetical protein